MKSDFIKHYRWIFTLYGAWYLSIYLSISACPYLSTTLSETLYYVCNSCPTFRRLLFKLKHEVCMYLYTYVLIYIYIYIYIYIRACVRASLCITECVFMPYAYVCMWVFHSICACTCVSVCSAHACVRAHVCVLPRYTVQDQPRKRVFFCRQFSNWQGFAGKISIWNPKLGLNAENRQLSQPQNGLHTKYFCVCACVYSSLKNV